MYRERLGGIKGMRPAESLGPISLFQGSTLLGVPRDFVVQERSGPAAGSPFRLNDLQRLDGRRRLENPRLRFVVPAARGSASNRHRRERRIARLRSVRARSFLPSARISQKSNARATLR